MFDDEDPRPSSTKPAADLLNELESIKGALADDLVAGAALPTDIPLLEDMVIPNLDTHADLLNIERIFDDVADVQASVEQPLVQFPRFILDVAISDDNEHIAEIAAASPVMAPTSKPSTSATTARVRPAYCRETFIQELIDEFIPQIEAELHKRLRQLDDAALRRLKDSE